MKFHRWKDSSLFKQWEQTPDGAKYLNDLYSISGCKNWDLKDESDKNAYRKSNHD